MTQVDKDNKEYSITDRHLEYVFTEGDGAAGVLIVDTELDVANTETVIKFAAEAAKWQKMGYGKAPSLRVKASLPDYMHSLLEQNRIDHRIHTDAKVAVDVMIFELRCMLKHLGEVEYVTEEELTEMRKAKPGHLQSPIAVSRVVIGEFQLFDDPNQTTI